MSQISFELMLALYSVSMNGVIHFQLMAGTKKKSKWNVCVLKALYRIKQIYIIRRAGLGLHCYLKLSLLIYIRSQAKANNWLTNVLKAEKLRRDGARWANSITYQLLLKIL